MAFRLLYRYHVLHRQCGVSSACIFLFLILFCSIKIWTFRPNFPGEDPCTPSHNFAAPILNCFLRPWKTGGNIDYGPKLVLILKNATTFGTLFAKVCSVSGVQFGWHEAAPCALAVRSCSRSYQQNTPSVIKQ